jgi:TetR/AcrR family transcriptional regulator
MDTHSQLRPGRHRLSRDEVRAHQRERIFLALEAVMSAKGYLDTSVADLIRAAKVSRQTFYELFTSKQDCFLASYARRQGALVDAILSTPDTKPPMDRFATLLRNYLAIMAGNPGLSRLYLVGVYAAGEQAIAARLEMQQQFVNVVAEVFGAESRQRRFICQALVASISTMVTNALLEDDSQAVLDLYEPLMQMTALLMPAAAEA